jgi:hypothetical protein
MPPSIAWSGFTPRGGGLSEEAHVADLIDLESRSSKPHLIREVFGEQTMEISQ